MGFRRPVAVVGVVQADRSIAAAGGAVEEGPMCDVSARRESSAAGWAPGLAGGRFAALALALGCALLGSGCAPRVKLRVPPAAIQELPLERKLSLLDQENDLLAAVDARDQQEERYLASRDAENDAYARKREAEDARDKADKARTPLDVPEAAIREAKLRIEFARKNLELQRALFRASDVALLAAEAKYEQARATEVLEAGLAGARGLRAEEFQAQTERMSQLSQQRLAEAAQKREAADKAQAELQAARAELTRMTGGAQGSAWVQ
jgi:hypothetical protein